MSLIYIYYDNPEPIKYLCFNRAVSPDHSTKRVLTIDSTFGTTTAINDVCLQDDFRLNNDFTDYFVLIKNMFNELTLQQHTAALNAFQRETEWEKKQHQHKKTTISISTSCYSLYTWYIH